MVHSTGTLGTFPIKLRSILLLITIASVPSTMQLFPVLLVARCFVKPVTQIRGPKTCFQPQLSATNGKTYNKPLLLLLEEAETRTTLYSLSCKP